MGSHAPDCGCCSCSADRVRRGDFDSDVPPADELERGPRWAITMPSERDRWLGQTDMRVELRGANADEIKAAFANLLVNIGWDK